MRSRQSLPLFLSALALALAPSAASAQVDARMLRHPDVSATQITFVYAGDIWVVAKTGGRANRLSSPEGEETFPRFSPDGSLIAFSGNYDGNTDVYVIPTNGGEPKRVTHHPMGDRVLEWTPDGDILFSSGRASGRQRFRQIYRVGAEGGLPTKLPLEIGELASIAEDGRTLAFTMKQRDTRSWKRYRGGTAPEIHLMDLETLESANLTEDPANDAHPMWHGATLYFLSDRGEAQRHNIWSIDEESGLSQITDFTDYDVTYPAIGPEDIVFQAGGTLYRYELSSGYLAVVDVEVVTDLATLKPHMENVSKMIVGGDLSPSGKRAVIEARGDVFSLPAKDGVIRNLTRTPGIHERHAALSPDGKSLIYWSDASGEYELHIRPADGSGEERQVTHLGAGYRYQPVWSPDSQSVAFINQLAMISIVDVETGAATEVQQSDTWMGQGQLQGFEINWSADSGFITYGLQRGAEGGIVVVYDVREKALHNVTSGYYTDSGPVFDPAGDYLYLRTNRSLQPIYSELDGTWIYPNATQLAAITLRKDVASPLAPKNDVEEIDEEEDEGEDDDGEESEEGDDESDESEESEEDDDGEDEEERLEIDFDDMESRLVVLPPTAGHFAGLAATKGKLIFHRRPNSGSARGAKSPLMYYDFEEREEKTIIDDVNGFGLAAKGDKLFVVSSGKFGILDVAPGQKLDKPLRTSELEARVDPRAEWKQIFADAWRLERDFFYDPNLHGVDWDGMKKRYGKLIDQCVTRWDVNFVLGELIGELNASHTYRGGGDQENGARRAVGLLGIDWALEDGAYKIAHIVRGAAWDHEVRSPLAQPGVEVNEGEYILAVNGVPLDTAADPYASFEGLAGKTVALTISTTASRVDARDVLVELLRSETRLRHLAWIEKNRKRVDEASDGKIGYVYVRSTGLDGQTELVRQFMPQFGKQAILVDERFNSGGQIPDRFIELLNRPPIAYWAVRNGDDWQWPPVGHHGHMAMLINGWSGSGGDAFPDYFRKAGLGPLVGTRTWGGLIGISGNPSLIDGGRITVPTFRMYNPDGEWFAEGIGVAPDIHVPEDPTALARGIDPQIEKGIEVLLEKLRRDPITRPKRPAYEDRTPGASPAVRPAEASTRQ